ncbi:hypothetical protein G6045_27565 [Streptomyces sp. YC504]|uniref:AG2 protein n=1 Tax=Streptomyces mesophilus TaxID=1775132 RepID=A0A6G4XPA2_9ACTN|nr:hypothetical protein [Streptomyces mesophilus]NGO79385.1 hypothetical protein [Streptomyces mesophilus]
MTELRLGKLKEAVDTWSSMVGKLQQLADGKAGGISASALAQQANGADWTGVNATVTRTFITNSSREFDHAAAEAKTIHGLLQDIHHDFAKHKTDLKTALADARAKNIRVHQDGSTEDAYVHSVGDGGNTDPVPQAELTAAAEKIGRILWEATETDRIAAKALRDIAKNKHGFDKGGPENLEAADKQQGKEAAAYWAKKIKEEDPGTWSDDELKRFNETLKNQRDNPGFTATLATRLSGEGTLEFWRELASPAGPPVEVDRAKMLAQVQDNLSMSLANATSSNAPGMDGWQREVIAAGDKQFPIREGLQGPYGYQIASSLMQKGKFDSDFLNDYGTSLIEFERKKGNDSVLGEPGDLWQTPFQLDYPPSDKPNDPVANFLDGLAHNPQAAVEFFDDSTSGKGLDEVNNLAYLSGAPEEGGGAVENPRKWPEGEDGKPAGYASLGHALESATLGYAYDDKTPEIPSLKGEDAIAAREERTALMGRVVDHYNTADQIDGQPGMRDSLARMASGHVDSLTYSVAGFGTSAKEAEMTGERVLFGLKENGLEDFGKNDSAFFLRALASDQDSYNTVSAAQQIYGSSIMAAQGDNQTDALDAGLYSVKVHGILDDGRFEAIGKEFQDDETAKNEELEKAAEWRNFAGSAVTGVAVGVGTALAVPTGGAALIAVPIAIETLGGAAETAWATNTMDWLEEREYDNSAESARGIAEAQRVGEHTATTPIMNYADSQGLSAHEKTLLEERAYNHYIQGKDLPDTDAARGHG